MTFMPGKEETFLEVFKQSRKHIRNFKGCTHLELLKDTNETNVFCTYSMWETESDLNHYRYSELFKTTWAKTKPLFAAKAVAYSLEKVM